LYEESVNVDMEALDKAYGKVGADEFIEMKEALDRKCCKGYPRDTRREDYEFWIDDTGVFTVSYKTSCSACGFKYEYNESDQAL